MSTTRIASAALDDIVKKARELAVEYRQIDALARSYGSRPIIGLIWNASFLEAFATRTSAAASIDDAEKILDDLRWQVGVDQDLVLALSQHLQTGSLPIKSIFDLPKFRAERHQREVEAQAAIDAERRRADAAREAAEYEEEERRDRDAELQRLGLTEIVRKLEKAAD
jgi:hypothetical protein